MTEEERIANIRRTAQDGQTTPDAAAFASLMRVVFDTRHAYHELEQRFDRLERMLRHIVGDAVSDLGPMPALAVTRPLAHNTRPLSDIVAARDWPSQDRQPKR